MVLLYKIKFLSFLFMLFVSPDSYFYILPYNFNNMRKETLPLQNLANQPDQQAYTAKPVENYGLNLLKGMGFDQKKGTRGSLDQKTIQILILKPRPKGLGLGAQNNEQATKQKLEVGDRIKIKNGSHANMCGFIIQVIDEKQLMVELVPSNSKIKIGNDIVEKISKEQMEKIVQNLNKDEPIKKKKLKWILPQIRAKVVDRSSHFYLQKVLITNLLNEREFECRDETGKILTELREKDLQTVIPKPGGIVMILKGQKRGQRAKLIQRKKSKNRVTVQTEQQLQMIKLDDDDVSEYVDC